MNAIEMRNRLEEIRKIDLERDLTLKEYHEALEICQDLGLDRAWQIFKRELEWRIEQAKQHARKERER